MKTETKDFIVSIIGSIIAYFLLVIGVVFIAKTTYLLVDFIWELI